MFGRFILPLLSCLIFINSAIAQKRTISFFSQDNVKIHADLFFSKAENPYVVLFHQENSSRGEYLEIAKKLLNLEYNCLVVDLRIGDEANYVKNITARQTKKKYSYSDCLKDVEASIDFAFSKTQKPLILFGSGFSASLCLVAAKNNKKVQAVIAFSPGEYLRPQINTKDELENYDKQVFIGSKKDELNYAKELMQPVTNSLKTFSAYESSKQVRGSFLLSERNASSDKFWFDLLLFFKRLNP